MTPQESGAAAALSGPGYLLRGAGLMWRPGVRRFVLLPLAINIITVVLLWWLAWAQIELLLAGLLGVLPGWLDWLGALLKGIVWIGSVLAFCFLFTWLANLIAAPFNGFLSARVEALLTGIMPESGLSLWQEALQGFLTELRKLWFYLTRALLLALVSLPLLLLPGVNALVPLLWMLFGAYMLALEYLDYPASNHALDFAGKRAWLRQHRLLGLGFGGVVTLVTAVPLLNLLVMPAAVAGATALWVDHAGDARRRAALEKNA